MPCWRGSTGSARRAAKGPHFVRDGDFASAGSVRIDYLDRVARNVALTTAGSFGDRRALTIASAPLGAGHLLVAGDARVYDGPWAVPDALRKLNGVVRYSQGTPRDGFAVTGMAYAARWTATDQVAERAVGQGLIGRFGTLDPADGVADRHVHPVEPTAVRLTLAGRF